VTTSRPDLSAAEPLAQIEDLYSECLPQLHAFAYRMLGDNDDALDAVQESFARALAAADTFRGDSAPLTWLFSIVRNTCLQKLRGAARRTFDGYDRVISTCAEATPTESEFERRTYVAQVKEGCRIGLLQCLPVSQRCVFVLHLLNGVSIAQVGEIMGKSPNSVRILLSRARSRLRVFLCENCALLGGTACKCADMIGFSLAHGLIERFRPEMSLAEIRDELSRFSDEVELYRSLPDAAVVLAAVLASGRYRVLTIE
jgi:RNA polymerase sigma-70 factor, ECF subfamily